MRPSCSSCIEREIQCQYDTRPDETRAIALKRKNQALEEQHAQLSELYGYLKTKSEPEAIEILRRVRSSEDLSSVLSLIRDGDLLLQGRLYRGSAKGPTQTRPVINFGTAEEYAYTQLLLEKMCQDGSLPDFRFAESETPKRSRRRLFPSLTDLLEPTRDVPPIRVPAKPWTNVTDDDYLVSHLISMYFTWEHPAICYLDKTAFLVDMTSGNPSWTTKYCSPLLVNAILEAACVGRLPLLSSFVLSGYWC